MRTALELTPINPFYLKLQLAAGYRCRCSRSDIVRRRGKSYDSVTLNADRVCRVVQLMMPSLARGHRGRGTVARISRVCFAFFVLYYKQVRLRGVRSSIRREAAVLLTDPQVHVRGV